MSISEDLLTCDRETHKLIAAIMRRFRNELPTAAASYDWISLAMDLAVSHNCGHVDLSGLLVAQLADLAHDIGGIVRHLDRETSDLTDCFLPRCRKPESEAS